MDRGKRFSIISCGCPYHTCLDEEDRLRSLCLSTSITTLTSSRPFKMYPHLTVFRVFKFGTDGSGRFDLFEGVSVCIFKGRFLRIIVCLGVYCSETDCLLTADKKSVLMQMFEWISVAAPKLFIYLIIYLYYLLFMTLNYIWLQTG